LCVLGTVSRMSWTPVVGPVDADRRCTRFGLYPPQPSLSRCLLRWTGTRL
jgi:hypothetical protein